MDFVDKDEVNYTLSGYFMKVANMVILSKPADSLKYIFTNQQILHNMKRHIYSKSISSLLMFILNTRQDILVKIVNLPKETSTPADSFFKEFNDFRIQLIHQLFLDCAETASQRDKLEIHLSSVTIVVHTIQNVENIADGALIVEKLFETDEIVKALIEQTMPESGDEMGNVGQIITQLIEFSKENSTDIQKCICKYFLRLANFQSSN